MIEQQVLLALTSGSPSPTSAGDRVYAMNLPFVENPRVPAVSYQRTGNTPIVSLSGHSGIDHVRMQVDAWASTYGAAKELATQVRAAMLSAGFKALMVVDQDDFEPDTGLYRVTADYVCWEK